MKKVRRSISVDDKVAIAKAHLVDKVPVSDLCDKHEILPNQFYNWQKQFFENGAGAIQATNRRLPPRSGRSPTKSKVVIKRWLPDFVRAAVFLKRTRSRAGARR